MRPRKLHRATLDEVRITRGGESAAVEFQGSSIKYQHMAVEVPPGQPQISHVAPGDQWTPRDGVLRCVADDGPGGRPSIWIDDRELSLDEFGRLLCTYASRGMRIEFVPDDDLERRPRREVRKPEDEARG